MDTKESLRGKTISIIAQIVGSTLYHLNDLLRYLARLLRSQSLLRLADTYTTWYNNYLMTNILHEGGITGEITDQDLRGTVMIATFRSHGHFAPNRMRQVLASYLGVQEIQIQVNKKGSGLYSIVFPIR